MNHIKVVGIGALNIDHLYQVERILEDGESVVNEVISSPGGSAANTIYGLAKLGVSAGFSGVVGDDADGKTVIQDFEQVGVDTSQTRVKHSAETGSVLCLSDRLGRRSLYILPNANNLLTPNDLDMDYINQAKIVHISSFVDDRQFQLLLGLMDRLDPSVKLSFSPGALYVARGLKTLAPLLARTYVLFLNESEIQQLVGEGIAAGAESCLRQGCHIVVTTLGKGSSHKTAIATAYIRDSEKEYVIEPTSQERTPVTDTTGAGDAFATGFLYGLLKGKRPEECGRLGDIVARFSITKAGARESLPTLAELSHRYQELYHQEL